MLQQYKITPYAIIVALASVLIIPMKGNAQTKYNKFTSKGENIKNPASKQKQIKKTIKSQSQLPNSTKFSTKIKALEKKLSLKKTELAEAKKTEIKKDGEISRLKSNSTKFSTKVQVLEKELALTKTELAEVKKTDVKKDGEISKLNEDINFLLDSLDDLDAELKVQVGAYEKYKKLITCYRTALINWDDLHRRQGLTEQDHFVIRIELRRSLFSCPPMLADNLAIYE